MTMPSIFDELDNQTTRQPSPSLSLVPGQGAADMATPGYFTPPKAVSDAMPTFRTDAPGGGYFLDQMGEAKDAWNRGESARALGIGARGALTSIPVAVAESFQRAGSELMPAMRGVGNFLSGLTGMDAPTLTMSPTVTTPRPPAAPIVDPTRSTPVPQANQDATQDAGPTREIASAIPAGASAPARDFKAELADFDLRKALKDAMEQRGVDERRAYANDITNALVASHEKDIAKNEASLAAWRATNGADMILGSPNLYADQRKAIMANAVAKVDQYQTASMARDAANKALSKLGPSPIDDLVKGQEALLKGNQAAQSAKSNALDLLLKQGKVDEARQLMNLRLALMSATAPKKIKMLQDQIAAFEGKVIPREKFLVVPNAIEGPPDAMNNPTKMAAVFNNDTGEFLTPPKAQKPFATEAEAHAEAKRAIASGAPAAAVNQRLKALGFGEVK